MIYYALAFLAGILVLYTKTLSLIILIGLIVIMMRKRFSYFHYFIIIIIPLISFMVFQKDLDSTIKNRYSMINKNFQVEAKFMSHPFLEHHRIKGEIMINKTFYKYIYHPENVETKAISNFLWQKSCNVNGQFKAVNPNFKSNLTFFIQNIEFSSCKSYSSTLIDLLHRHKAFIYKKLRQWDINSPEKAIAFITGNTAQMEKDEIEKIKDIGIYHLLAISGTHIAIIIGIVFYMCNLFKCPLLFIKMILLFLLPVYCFYTNMSPSAIRAVSMSLIILIFPKYIMKNAMDVLGGLFIVLTLINPSLIYHIGFQFSFLITFFILFSSPLLTNVSPFKSLIYITLIAQLGSFIISAIHFHQIQWIGLISNLFFVPFYSFILFPLVIILTCFIHFPFKITMLSILYNNVVFIHDKFVENFEKINSFKWYIPVLNDLQITGICIILFVNLLLLVNKHFKMFIFALVILYIFSTVIPQSKDYQLTMLNVGQGDAFLFETQKHEVLLIDTGGQFNSKQTTPNHNISKYHILPTLKRHNIKKIDYVVITHPHIDHMGELEYLIQKQPIENIIINQKSFKPEELNHLRETSQKYNVKLLDFKNKPRFLMDKAHINLLDATILNSDNLNEQSIIILIQYRKYKILLMGDATMNNESILMQKYNLYNVDVLKVGHHGSKTSTSEALLQATKPKIALISAGNNNRYGLPNKLVINKLQSLGAKILQTHTDGEVSILFRDNILLQTHTD
ncbi:DNA internalization-related competence protein ComEC/Rec2 [Staphylococcus nepalensis]|uniref:DNA internalization-related competence protein ComEC/Rec2 n=4 Tax=Staphylococcus TaxID=1279 RepID=UPI001F6159D7|nr:DNA internalization-related competence protein ComEC/Rec2 [Staphylococcus nepalensis]MDW8551746.1 DNA internalization-related competence protein ComEC/Rec2 [Staphylococcus nepalensis]